MTRNMTQNMEVVEFYVINFIVDILVIFSIMLLETVPRDVLGARARAFAFAGGARFPFLYHTKPFRRSYLKHYLRFDVHILQRRQKYVKI